MRSFFNQASEGTGGHPFHIHVNPFEIVKIVDNGNGDADVTGDLKGVWKDTLFIQEGHTYTLRTRYQRYIGEFVLHCHILDHEDQGMMQNVSIAIPQTTAAGGHHGH